MLLSYSSSKYNFWSFFEGKLQGEPADRVYAVFKSFATSIHENVAATQSIHEAVLEIWRCYDNPGYKESFCEAYRQIFYALDFDNDGFISKEEFGVFWRSIGFDMTYMSLQFDYMDKDGDGKISLDDYIDAALEYNFNIDDSTSANRLTCQQTIGDHITFKYSSFIAACYLQMLILNLYLCIRIQHKICHCNDNMLIDVCTCTVYFCALAHTTRVTIKILLGILFLCKQNIK
ncbi:unnamed protein product [Owenia fusiformis]|uniref:EF-hand domain-containing protein n=1 Tax=Owenia fusiformis TaxID=6347 RepID=A0A8S4PNI2_OWEFU|nr:unnamed protein product [Owenia fusiformis]